MCPSGVRGAYMAPKMASGSAHGAFVQHNVPQRQNKHFLAYFGGILAVPREKARFRPILTHFEATFISWPLGRSHLGERRQDLLPAVCNHPTGEPRTTLGHIPKYVGV